MITSLQTTGRSCVLRVSVCRRCGDDAMAQGQHEYYELANDWAFMVPIVEMACSPSVIPEPLYFYERAQPQHDREEREYVIREIVARRSYAPEGEELYICYP